ncbi:MAG: response regulator transcription factor [Bacteroidales bacterium]|jgi:two-component system alkaline phosphatase synthesis response regulator PhoP|nr:response regulator transcription factor [Bacteroidales bacterium]MDD4215595.1 response regulator transcription factor [Bacteroidales bacterium]
MNNSYTILLVDDEPDIVEFLSYNLKREGFKVYSAGNGKDGVNIAKEIIPHLVILDVMMPGLDGIETCSELKKIPELNKTLIMFLTARGEDYSQIAGLDAGADDYVSKPVKPKVLISRINALLRRYSDEVVPQNSTIKIHDLIIDREKFVVIKQGQKIILPKKEFELLYLLASKPNKVFTREEILSNIWGYNVIVGDRTIDVHIRKVREKIGMEFVSTVKGIGYKFEN